jgi:nicotinate-nucleotide adenylyltransferase
VATGIFGGTFDPVHIGHLRTALELREFLKLDRMLLVPCGDPPHRQAPMTPGAQRLAMVELAIQGEPGLIADGRELRRKGFSYSIDTLLELRAELGNDEPLCFCMGMDSLNAFDSWHRWREFLDICHIVVVARPGWRLPEQGEVAKWISSHRVVDAADLLARPAGYFFVEEMTLLPVAATELRAKLKTGDSIRYLTPNAVIDYIHSHRLYVQS